MTSLQTLVLNRFAFGPSPADMQAANANFNAWFQAQLSPPAGDDPITQAALAAVRLNISYTRQSDGVAINENRPLTWLNSTQAQLWALTNQTNFPDGAERNRPAVETRAASLVRAVSSSYQLRETMAQFWHNHFSANAFDNNQTAVGFPIYDQIMRGNALGNFRTLLGQVAKSVTMMYFLNLQSNNKKVPNENYARELMELHTLGIVNYYGTTGTNPAGYTDTDVTAAARAFTGWTISTADGSFTFNSSWHDTGPKQVLGLNLPGTGGQQEGEQILDVLARHPGTAQYLALKLCRFFVSDTPPNSLVQAVAETWLANVTAPNQIALAIQTIVNAPEFAASAMQKVKDPFQLVTSALRATQATWTASNSYVSWLNLMGYPLYQWPTPDGIPATGSTWSGTDGMLQRWNAMVAIFTNASMTTTNFSSRYNAASVDALAILVAQSLLSYPASATSLAGLIQLAEGSTLFGNARWLKTATAAQVETRMQLLVAAALSLPEFQVS